MAKKKKAKGARRDLKIGGVSLKDIDFKDFFIRKGEKIALSIALVVTVLLIVMGLVVKGLALTSPDTTAAQLDNEAKAAQDLLAKADPKPEDGEAPKWLASATDLRRADYSTLAIEDEFFPASTPDDDKWRQPVVLGPDEFDVAVARVGVPSYYFSQDFKTVYMRVQRKASGSDISTKPFLETLNHEEKKRLNSGRPLPAAWQMLLARLKQTQHLTTPAAPTGRTGQGSSAQPDYDLKPFTAAEMTTIAAEPAKLVRPYTMAIISGAFPYKQQMENFRKALHYATVTEMLSDKARNPAVEFFGFEVQRRTLSLDGKELHGWAPLDLDTRYREMSFLSVERLPEDSEWEKYGLVVMQIPAKRLIQRLPKPAEVESKDDRAVDTEHAPKVTALDGPYPRPNLPSLTKALEEMKKSGRNNQAPEAAPPSRFDPNRFDPDSDTPGQSLPAPGGAEPGAPQPGSGRNENPTGEGEAGGFHLQGGGRAAALKAGQEALLPEHCFFRFLDLTVEPERAYEYRVRIRMGNPNFGRKDLAVSELLTKDREITASGFTTVTTKVDGKEMPLQARVDNNTQLYAVNEAPDPILGVAVGGDRQPATSDEAPMQIHRWLDTMPLDATNPDSVEINVGAWAIMERTLVRRGEYIGHVRDTPVPFWDPAGGDFILINQHPERLGQRAHKGLKVNFNSDALLVDFQGSGASSVQVGDKKISLDTPLPMELLILSPDGHLVVHNQAADTEDPERVKRVAAWKERLVAIAKKSTKKGPGAAGGGAGRRPGGGGGGGGGGGP